MWEMPQIGRGVYEIRIRVEEGIFRTIYIAKFEEAVYVLHAFQKKDPTNNKTWYWSSQGKIKTTNSKSNAMNSVRVKSTENIFEAIGFEKEEAGFTLDTLPIAWRNQAVYQRLRDEFTLSCSFFWSQPPTYQRYHERSYRQVQNRLPGWHDS